MKRRRSHSKIWPLVAISLLGIVVLVFVVSDKRGDSSRYSGTVGGAAVGMEDATGAWSGTGVGTAGRLDDVFTVSVQAVNRMPSSRSEGFELYFSRDEQFDVDADCRVDQRTVTLPAAAPSSVQFRSRARNVRCLDAGPWYVAVRSATGEWIKLEDQFTIANGVADVELAALQQDIAPRGTLNIGVDVMRPRTESGFDGLHDLPVDVWLRQNETVCLIEAAPVHVPRESGTSMGEQWHTARKTITASLRDAEAVDMSAMTVSPFRTAGSLTSARACETCQQPVKTGSCRLSEGPVEVVVGPTASSRRVVQTVYHHASPVVVETGAIQVSVKVGEVVQVSRTAYNPSVNDVSWRSVSVGGSEWMIGMSDQKLPARTPSKVEFTVSAADLEPGIYQDSIRFAAADFYGTEIVLPVEVDVRADRSVVEAGARDAEVPNAVSLGNYPNPFNPTTTIQFALPQRERVSLVVFDVSGRQVRVLHDGELGEGMHEFRFDADGLPSGTYLYRLTTPTYSKTESMVLLK